MSAPRVLLTRPSADSAALAARLGACGWAPMVWPLLDIVPTGARPDSTGVQAVLLTSANAARAVAAHDLAPLPPRCLCVGAATAAAAREAGYGGIEAAEGDADSLAALIRAQCRPADGPLLFLRGADVAADLGAMLAAEGFSVRQAIVYKAVAATVAPPEVASALQGGSLAAALFFSPRTATVFAGLAAPWRGALGGTRAVAISGRAAAPLADLGFGAVAIAATPDEPAMLAALGAASRGLDQTQTPR